MKFELREPQYTFDDKLDDGYLELYITKNAFIKSFELDKKQCYKEFSICAEMYTAPHCFEGSPEFNSVENLYNTLKTKSKYKGIIFGITEIYDYSINKLGTPMRSLFIALV